MNFLRSPYAGVRADHGYYVSQTHISVILAGEGFFSPYDFSPGMCYTVHVTTNPLMGIIVGVALACIMALVIGFFCVRHTEIYFAMLTLAFKMMVFPLDLR